MLSQRQSAIYQRVVAIVQELEFVAIEFGRRQAEGGRPNAERQELVRLMHELWGTIEPLIVAYEQSSSGKTPRRRFGLSRLVTTLSSLLVLSSVAVALGVVI